MSFLLLLLLAHDLYLMPQSFRPAPGQPLTIAIHKGDNFPVSMTMPNAARIVAPRLLTAPGPGAIVAALNTKPNFIELEASKFGSYLKHEGLDHVIAWRAAHQESAVPGRERYSKYVKSLLRSSLAGEFRKANFLIEIVPLADPYALPPGARLPIQVLVRNQPAPGLQIEAATLDPRGHARRTIVGRTDAEGKLGVSLEGKGTWKLHAVYMERCQEPSAADWESFWASLTFAIN
jgi:hypothetical protein